MPLPVPLTLHTLVDPHPPIPGVPHNATYPVWYVLDDAGEAVYAHPDQATAIAGLLAFQAGEVDAPMRAAPRANAEAILRYELQTMPQVEAEYLATRAEFDAAQASLATTLARVEAQAARPASPGVFQTLLSRLGVHAGLLVWFRGKPVFRPYLRFRWRLWGR